MKIAIVGAGGFVGSRAVEYLTLSGKAEVRAVVRRYASLARLSRFSDVEWRIAEAGDEESLAEAFHGCQFVLHVINGDNRTTARCAYPAYRAAERAGVKRIVFISSAAVFGNLQDDEVDENTIVPNKLSDYAAAKLHAETEFLKLGLRGKVEVVVFRPSIIIGPRSPWVWEPAKFLLSRQAWLEGGGTGICNVIYVDDLIEASFLAFTKTEARGEIFLIGNNTPVTWMEYYLKLGRLVGATEVPIRRVEAPEHPKSTLRRHLRHLRSWPVVSAAVLLTPVTLKRAIRRVLKLDRPLQRSDWQFPDADPEPSSPELANLHRTTWRMRTNKSENLLGFQTKVSIDEGLQRSADWLRYAGWVD
jgi:nucleoside-diphosphate-sugar epimerase